MTFHIIVIDDDPALQEFYRLFFENEGYKVTVLSPFAIFPDAIITLQANIIILDVVLGGCQNGWSILQTLLSTPQTAKLPVLLVTALSLKGLEEEQQMLLQERKIPFVVKPFNVDLLLATMRSLFPDSGPPPENSSYLS
ncbi:MAG TPA: response regulator [Ktedonobacteraceae bacterium]